ncbi:MAG: TylF/MycF/NovP-related O-methyltransferase [Dictyoglomaceae bacterium]|nr:TylF/MycF/NovP-related O-methyltransferase [Dictyoglomaceae bacterium]
MKTIKNYIKKKLYNFVTYILDDDAHNIDRELQRIAKRETAEFILKENLIKTKAFNDRLELLSYAVSTIEVEGLILEFGVYQGETINIIASLLKDKTIYGFDSFEGLPETWRFGFEEGTFAVNKLPKVKQNVLLIKGWFHETLPEFLKAHNQQISLMHIDCDLYSSTKTIFNILGDKIVPGTVIIFDEFFNYPTWMEGEYKAFCEFVKERNINFEYIGFVKYHEQVGIKITHV